MSTEAPEIRSVLERRLALILIVAGGLTAVAAAVIFALPDVYVARSVVHLERRRLPKSFEQAGVVVPPLSEAIGLLRQEALSRDVLREVAADLDLYESGARASVGFADPTDRARADIDIKILKLDEQEFVEISARARTGALAARTVNRIAEVLSARNRDLRLRLAEDVIRFQEGELAKTGKRLEDEDARLKRFRAEHPDSLPESRERLSARLVAVGIRAEDHGRKADEAKDRIAGAGFEIEGVRARARLAAQRADEALAALAAGVAPPSGPAAPPVPTELHALTAELEALQKLDEELAGKYTKEHPDRLALAVRIGSAQIRLLGATRRATTRVASSAAPAGPGYPAATTPVRAAPGADPKAPSPMAGDPSPFDGKTLLAELVLIGASPEAIERAQVLLGAIAVHSLRLDALARDHARDLLEIDRLERQKAALEPVRLDLERVAGRHEEALKEHSDLLAERQAMQKFLDAEKALQGDQLRTIEAAEAPLVPAEPRRLLLIAIALGASLALGFTLAYLLELRKSKVTEQTYPSSLEIESDLGIRALGVLPSVATPEGLARRLARPEDALGGCAALINASLHDGSGLILSEQFDRLRHRLKNAPGGRQIRSILVTSAVHGEGKTLVATGLARAFAESMDDGSLLVESDLRRPALARHLGIRAAPGLSDYLATGATLEDVIRRTTLPRLSVICAGEPNGGVRANALASLWTQPFVDDVKKRRPDRMLIIDGPPIGAALESLALASFVDGIVLVVRADSTRRDVVAQAIRELPEEKILGIVLNRLPPGRDEPRLYGSSYDTKDPSRYAPANGDGNGDGNGSGDGNGNGNGNGALPALAAPRLAATGAAKRPGVGTKSESPKAPPARSGI